MTIDRGVDMAEVVEKNLMYDDRILLVDSVVRDARLFCSCFCKVLEARLYRCVIMFSRRGEFTSRAKVWRLYSCGRKIDETTRRCTSKIFCDAMTYL